MTHNKEIILNYIKKRTRILIQNKRINDNGIDAQEIAFALKLDRSNVSRDLNQLWKKGFVIKIGGRPVFFLDKKTIEESYPGTSVPVYIPKEQKLEYYLERKKENEASSNKTKIDIDRMIGANGSLSQEIEKAKAAVSYPPYGLCSIISGNIGTEKNEFAKAMIDYALNNKIKNGHYPYYIINCRNYGDASSFDNYFFGYIDKNDVKKRGLLQKCTNGFIVLQNIEFLYPSSLNLLVSMISNRYYTNVYSDDIIELKTMIIMTTDLDLNDQKIQSISSFVPVKIKILDLDDRGIYEKIELIMDIFAKEAKSIHRNLKVAKDVIYWLSAIRYKTNITELQNAVQSTISNAHIDALKLDSSTINVALHNLPGNLISLTSQNLESDAMNSNFLDIIDETYISFDENGESKDFEKYRNFPLLSASHLFSQFIDEFNVDLETLSNIDDYVNENINCLANLQENQLNKLKENINPYILQITRSNLLNINEYTKLYKHHELLYGILLHISNAIERYQRIKNNSQWRPYNSASKKLYPDEYSLAKKIMGTIEDHFKISIDPRETDFLCNYLAIANKWANQSKVAILVIAHGQSTASDMVNYIKNNIEGEYYIDSIDFRKDLQLNDCLELATIRVSAINQGLGVLIITDKEPLLGIGDYVMRKTGIPTKTLSPLSLPLLIEIVKKTINIGNDLSSLMNRNSNATISQLPEDEKSKFIANITERVISKTLVFLDAHKAVSILMLCLEKQLNDLNIPYSDEIAAKYLCHTSNMIERLLRNDTWENPRLNKFMRKYPKLMEITDSSLESACNSFGIQIPKNELVYIAEIFLPYIINNNLIM